MRDKALEKILRGTVKVAPILEDLTLQEAAFVLPFMIKAKNPEVLMKYLKAAEREIERYMETTCPHCNKHPSDEKFHPGPRTPSALAAAIGAPQ